MVDIVIISVGKIKEKFWQDAIGEYVKRLKPYVKLNFFEVPEEKINQVTDRQRILAKEGEKIIKIIPKDCIVVSLDRTGKIYTSTDWSGKIEEWSKFGQKITFIIGGPLGLSADVLNKSQVLLSLSKMTFTHQMVRVILLEQIYRAMMISQGKTYHY